MASGRDLQLTKQVGEYLVAAELARRKWIVAVLSGNTPEFDLVATRVDGRSVPVQVKAISGAGWQFTVSRFVEVEMEGTKQVFGKERAYPPNLVCVLVRVGTAAGGDQCYVMPMRTLQKLIIASHQAYLEKHGGVRPRKPESMHMALPLSQVERYRDRWDYLEKAASRVIRSPERSPRASEFTI